MKYLRVTMPDGSQWDVPAENIARDYSKQYEDPESQDGYSMQRYRDALKDNELLEDWAANNMDWDDVKADAVQFKGPDDVDYQEGWVNGEKEIVER